MVEIAYWSGTGNTEAMAQEIAAAAKAAGADVESVLMEDTTPDAVAQHDVILLGCPAMGSEELEDSVVEPFFTAIAPKLSGKKVAAGDPAGTDHCRDTGRLEKQAEIRLEEAQAYGTIGRTAGKETGCCV